MYKYKVDLTAMNLHAHIDNFFSSLDTTFHVKALKTEQETEIL